MKTLMAAISPAGSPIVGTLEAMEGTALADVTVDEKGRLAVEYSGETKVDWDSQKTQVAENERLFVCSAHLIWRESEVRLATAQHAPVRFRRNFTVLISAADVARRAGRLRDKLEMLHPGEVLGVDATERGWTVHLKSRNALRDKLRLFDTWYDRKVEYRVGGKARSLPPPAAASTVLARADALSDHTGTLQEIHEATQIHYDVIRREKSARLRDVVDGMAITLAKIRTVLADLNGP